MNAKSLEYRNLNQLSSFKELSSQPEVSLRKTLNKKRIKEYQASAGGGLTYHYAAKKVDELVLGTLQKLADEHQLTEKYNSLLSGAIMNTGERRPVLHHLTRGQVGPAVIYGERNQHHFYHQQLQRIKTFGKEILLGSQKGSTGKPFKFVVQIGIGGSELGPHALYLALETLTPPHLNARFVANIDPVEPLAALEDLDLEETLFIVVSKSGTTQETLANLDLLFHEAHRRKGLDLSSHLVAVTAEGSPLSKRKNLRQCFYIDDFVGGRFSSTSAVGAALLIFCFGSACFEEVLQGAHEADKAATNPELRSNAALLDALIGVHERNILKTSATAILPYCRGLARFPAHLQQLDMESNGKSVNRFGKSLSYSTGPIVLGEPGTNAQHSFFQLLHQGSDPIPLQFIGFKEYVYRDEGPQEYYTSSQEKLTANLLAQMIAFALGQKSANPNTSFAGERPSSLLWAEQLSPRTLGALLAHFENKILFQGLTWNLNSFDQEGVQLGKRLTDSLLSGQATEPLSSLAKFFCFNHFDEEIS